MAMTNRENDEQKAISQTLCGALQKEANCKCLVLSVLIYGCLAAVSWCRCANLTKVVLDITNAPSKSTKHVSPCDDGYIYIPVAFMGMLYLVYLVECYHSPSRIDLLHAESQGSLLSKLAQLKLAQPTIWWKAISYHYVRKKRQITRYRNGDNYTTTQVYYERVNTQTTTSSYFYDYCGLRDISKELLLDPKMPITKINLTKGFAFSNIRSATEFEEARSRFFAEQEFHDDYMEMREGLDLGYNFAPVSLVSILGNPWFTRPYVYWLLSALLLSWPLRIIIECRTQYVDYQITKLFGVNYDTPTNIQIHTSASQLSAPGSYMLAPSYSEALLMEPSANNSRTLASINSSSTLVQTSNSLNENIVAEIEADHRSSTLNLIPSYSEALLCHHSQRRSESEDNSSLLDLLLPACNDATCCECPCHHGIDEANRDDLISNDSIAGNDSFQGNAHIEFNGSCHRSARKLCRDCIKQTPSATFRHFFNAPNYPQLFLASTSNGKEAASAIAAVLSGEIFDSSKATHNRQLSHQQQLPITENNNKIITREKSEPDLRAAASKCQTSDTINRVWRSNIRSLESVVEKGDRAIRRNDEGEALILDDRVSKDSYCGKGAIPKKGLIVNPLFENNNCQAYFCLRTILKKSGDKRHFTLIMPELSENNSSEVVPSTSNASATAAAVSECRCGECTDKDINYFHRPKSLLLSKARDEPSCKLKFRRDEARTLIFASPVQVICPFDPFRGQQLVPSENPPAYEEALNFPILARIRRSLADRADSAALAKIPKNDRLLDDDDDDDDGNSENHSPEKLEIQSLPIADETSQLMANQAENALLELNEQIPTTSRLTRSLSERRKLSAAADASSGTCNVEFRKSCTDRIDTETRVPKRTNINIETSL